jgi:hypothetical protein
MKITFTGLFFVLYCIHRCLIFPSVIVVLRKHRPGKPSAPRGRTYALFLIESASFAGFALFVAFLNRISVFGSIHPDLKVIILASAFLTLNLSLDPLM